MVFRYGELEQSLIDSVREGVEGRRIGVAFSGGLDSGLVSAIARDFAEHIHLYTCGTANAYDVVMARDLSEKLGLPWTHVQISKTNVESLIREFITATGVSDPFTISYELQLFSVCRVVQEDTILTGQGSDEYFMGCAKFVDQSDSTYDILKDDSVERLLQVSVPCELDIAKHFGKTLVYPYLDQRVIGEVSKLDPEELRPKDMDSRKQVLKDIAIHLGYPYLLDRKKRFSQYGSGTTDLIRALARDRGVFYNQYIASLYDDVMSSELPASGRGSVINARVDSVLKASAERIISENGQDPSMVIERLYRRIIRDGLDWI